MRKRLKRQGFLRQVVVTDKLGSYGSARKALGLCVRHEQGLRNRRRFEPTFSWRGTLMQWLRMENERHCTRTKADGRSFCRGRLLTRHVRDVAVLNATISACTHKASIAHAIGISRLS